MNRIEICKNIIRSIKEYITTPQLMEVHRDPNHFIRNRILSMLHVVTYLLYSSKSSMLQNLAGIRDDLSILDFPNVTKQSVSKARQFIHPSLFKELFYLSVDHFYSSIPERKTWHGYHLFAVDGSRIELPNSKSNFEYFGKMFTIADSEGHQKYYTQGLASIIYDVLEDYVVHASLNPYLASERASALEHLKNLEDLNLYDNSVIIFDRGYFSENMFAYCTEHNHYCVMRLKEKLNLSRKALKNGDLITTLSIGDKKNPLEIRVRVLCVLLPDGSFEFLATNIFDETITAEMFRELYFYRWPVELKYKELKSRLQMEEFNGATTTAVFQEFYINLLLSNLSSLVKNQADSEISTQNNASDNKYRYQANRSFILGRIKKTFVRIIIGELSIDSIDEIYLAALKAKSQIQPGRSCKRSKNVRHRRTHFRNMKTSF